MGCVGDLRRWIAQVNDVGDSSRWIALVVLWYWYCGACVVVLWYCGTVVLVLWRGRANLLFLCLSGFLRMRQSIMPQNSYIPADGAPVANKCQSACARGVCR